MTRPRPVTTSETEPFWQAARQGSLRLPQCNVCGQLSYPPAPRCCSCRSDALSWKQVSGDARLLSWTRVELPTIPGVQPPFTIAEIELVEQTGLVMTVLVRPELADRLRTGKTTGMAIRVAFDEDGDWSFPVATEGDA
jgi:uncharacterized OB-fold protein